MKKKETETMKTANPETEAETNLKAALRALGLDPEALIKLGAMAQLTSALPALKAPAAADSSVTAEKPKKFFVKKDIPASVDEAPNNQSVDWSKEIVTCPKCERTGPVDPFFGTRPVRGVMYRQSYCKECRGAKPDGSYARQRAYVPRKPKAPKK